ncbi:MAG: hypothetical protein JNK53_00740, partial [Phycisphaerae bacterium]|nr:hypothetical protein [Phycisphaerae bacterium]
MHITWIGGTVLAASLAALVAPSASAGLTGVGMSGLRLSEIRVDQQGADTDEYFEIVGTSGRSLAGW